MLTNTPSNKRRPLWLDALLCVLLWLGTTCRADEIIDRIRKDLNDPEADTVVLEAAVLENPQREDYWEELLLTRGSVSNNHFLNFCYAGAALKAHPNSLALRWAKLRFYGRHAALDELAVLAKDEPNKERLRDAREVLEIGMSLPHVWRSIHAQPG